MNTQANAQGMATAYPQPIVVSKKNRKTADALYVEVFFDKTDTFGEKSLWVKWDTYQEVQEHNQPLLDAFKDRNRNARVVTKLPDFDYETLYLWKRPYSLLHGGVKFIRTVDKETKDCTYTPCDDNGNIIQSAPIHIEPQAPTQPLSPPAEKRQGGKTGETKEPS